MSQTIPANDQTAVIHSTFEIEREYPVPVKKVFHAFADEATKRRWFVEGEGWAIEEYTADFRIGGREFSRFRFGDGPWLTNETLYQDIIPERRLVFTYKMMIGDQPLSVSLATIQLAPTGKGTLLTYTEQSTYLDGNPDGLKCRLEG